MLPGHVDGVPIAVAVDHLPPGVDDGRRADDGGTFAGDGLGVFRREGIGPCAEAGRSALGAAGRDDQRVGAHVGHGHLDGHRRPAADLHHGDHGRHADDHAEHGQSTVRITLRRRA